MDHLSPIAYAILALSLLIITGFFNFVSSLYSDIDISKIDLSKLSRRKKKIKKIIYIIKNNYFLFVGTSVLSVILNVFISRIIFGGGNLGIELRTGWVGSVTEILTILFLVLLTEILVRYLAEKEFAKRRIFNPFLLTSAHLITRIVA